MAQLHKQQSVTMDLSGRKGLADKFYGDINQFGYSGDMGTGKPQHRYLAKDGQMVSGIFNPLRKYGYLYPSTLTAYEIASGSSVPFYAASIYDYINDKSYFLGSGLNGGSVVLDILSSIDGTTTSTDRTMPVGTTYPGDIEIYDVNGVRHLMYSYNTGSAWRIGIKNLTTSAFTDNWLGSGGTISGAFEPSSNGEMKMIAAGDGYMYVLNANAVHRIDGTTLGGANGTVTRDVLLAPTYFRFSSGIDHRGSLYIAVQRNTTHEVHGRSYFSGNASNGNYNGDVGVYIWNRQSTFFNTSDFIPIKGAKEIRRIWVDSKNRVMCITLSSNNVTQIRKFTGSQFEVVKELGSHAFPNHDDSLTVVNGFTVWLGYDGNLYYYGSEIPGEEDFLFIMKRFVSSSGLGNIYGACILYAGGNTFSSASNEKDFMESFYVSYAISASSLYFVKYFPHASSPLTGGVSTTIAAETLIDTYTPVKYLPKLSTVKDITIYMARENVSGTSDVAYIKVFKNNSTTELFSKPITNDDIAKGYKSIEVNVANVDCIQLAIKWQVSAMSDTVFAPAFAIINYENPGSSR